MENTQAPGQETTDASRISHDAINRAKAAALEGDLESVDQKQKAEHTAGEPTTGAPDNEPFDPATDQMPEYDWQARTTAARSLATLVVDGVIRALRMAGNDIEADETEIRELGEVSGDAIRHYIQLREGDKAGDTTRAVLVLGAFAQRKLAQLEENRPEAADGTND